MSRIGNLRREVRAAACSALLLPALVLGSIGDARAQPDDPQPPTPAAPSQAALAAGDGDGARLALEAALAENPADTALRYQLARVLAGSGATEAALAEYDTLLASHPDNADWLLGRAQMLSRQGRVIDALAATSRALALAPDYEDVWRLHLALADRAGDAALADTVRADSAARFPDAGWWRVPEPIPEYMRFVSLGIGGDRLSNGAPDWRRRTLRLDWQHGNALYYVERAAAERFDASDATLALGGVWQALPAWRIGGSFAGTGNADFAPTRELSVEALRSWHDGWGSEFRYRRREYDTATVSSYAFTGDRYISSFRIAYRLDYSWLHGADSSLGHSLTLNWYANDRRSFGLTLGAGEEIETIGIDALLRTSVSSLTLSGRETLSSRIELSWWLGTHEQGDFYRRDYAGISARIGF